MVSNSFLEISSQERKEGEGQKLNLSCVPWLPRNAVCLCLRVTKGLPSNINPGFYVDSACCKTTNKFDFLSENSVLLKNALSKCLLLLCIFVA